MSDRSIAVRLFVITFVAYIYFFNGGGWNQNASFALTRSIVEHQRLDIDRYDNNTGDVTVGRRQHLFANKAPGLSLLSVPPYAVIYAIERLAGVDPNGGMAQIINLWLLTIVICALPGALTVSVLYLYLRKRVVLSGAAAPRRRIGGEGAA